MRLSKVTAATLAALLALTMTGAALTQEEAIQMAIEAEAILPSVLAGTYVPDPGVKISLTIEYDATGAVKSHTILKTNMDDVKLSSVQIIYEANGCKTYICIDYIQTTNNKVTLYVCTDINNPDSVKIEDLTPTTPPAVKPAAPTPSGPAPAYYGGKPPVCTFCKTTGYWECKY